MRTKLFLLLARIVLPIAALLLVIGNAFRQHVALIYGSALALFLASLALFIWGHRKNLEP